MDPMTHALLGSSAARVAGARSLGRAAWLPGLVGGLLPDVDALIRSGSDPLLQAELHRHFTHALPFVPLGALVAALPWVLRRSTRPRWRAYWGAAAVGYATHALLDASTTYGTVLLWPFATTRVAWNWISIVDPVFTLVLLLGVALALWRGSARPAVAALVVCAAYLGVGAAQRERALRVQEQVAAARGHSPVRGEVFPGFANQLVWRSLYQAGDSLYSDRIRVPWAGEPTWSSGSSAALLQEPQLPPEVLARPRSRRDFRRFRWLADGWVARAAGDPELIGDARYSLREDRFEPVWGIRLSGRLPTTWVDRSREREMDVRALWAEVRGRDSAQQAVPGR